MKKTIATIKYENHETGQTAVLTLSEEEANMINVSTECKPEISDETKDDKAGGLRAFLDMFDSFAG